MRLEQFTYIFYFFYLMLPEYFAVEISSALPLLTVGRMCILILLIAHIVVHKGKIVFVKLPKLVKCFFAIMIAVNMVHIIDVPADSVKALFSIVFEQVTLLILIVYSLNTEEKVQNALKYMVWGSAVLGVLGIVEVVTGTNVFYALNTVNRKMLQASYERLGMLRAEGSFGHPVYYGVYSVSMVAFSLFLYESSRKKSYLFIALLNVLGVILSSSRGQILTLAILFLYMYINKNKEVRKKYFLVLLGLIPVFLVILFFVPALGDGILSIIKSTLNAVGFNFEVSNFGDNVDGLYSRLSQLSGITWAFKQGAWLFGFGANTQVNGLVRYLTQWGWSVRKTFDIGYVGIFMQYGLIGSIGYICLYGYMFSISKHLRNRFDNKNIFNAFYFYTVATLLNLLSTVGVDSVNTIILGMLIASQSIFLQTKRGRGIIE